MKTTKQKRQEEWEDEFDARRDKRNAYFTQQERNGWALTEIDSLEIKGFIRTLLAKEVKEAVEKAIEAVRIDMSDCEMYGEEEPTVRIFSRAGFQVAVDDLNAKIDKVLKEYK